MKIYLLDLNDHKCGCFRKYFSREKDVEIVCDNFAHFMDDHKDIGCIVSPANMPRVSILKMFSGVSAMDGHRSAQWNTWQK